MKSRILKIAPLIMAVVLPLALQAVNTIVYTATYGNVTLGTDTLGGVTYTTVTYDGLWNGGDPGAPSLPIDYIRFSVPYNATNFTVNATLSNNAFANIPHLVYPCQQPRMMEDTVPWSITLPDNSIYNSGSYYPVNNAWVVDEGFLAGENHIVTVAVMPISFRYTKNGHLTTRLLRKSQSVNLTLSYELSDTPNIYPLVRKDSLLRQEGHKFTRGMVVNPDSVITFAPPQSYSSSLMAPITPPDNLDINTDSVYYDCRYAQWASSPYLIVTTPELRHSMRRLAALKRQKGYGVKIVTMENVLNDSYASVGDVVANVNGGLDTTQNEAGILRQYLKKAYMLHGTKYVLFAGNGVPFRYYYYSYPKFFIPSDLYYSELDYNWNWPDVSREYELAVGRLLGTTKQQISNYTDKLFRYELNPGGGDYAYLKKVFCSEGIDFKEYNCFSEVNKQYKLLFCDSTHIKESLETISPSGTDIINLLNQDKHGYISMMNHAGPSGWIVYGKIKNNNQDPFYYLWAIDTVHYASNNQTYNRDPHTGNGLNNLDNKKYPSILYSSGCSTIPFDKAPDYDSVKVCLGESFTMGKDYGGPAFLGFTRSGNQDVKLSILEHDFIYAINNRYYHVGLAEAQSKLGVAHLEESIKHNLIGDPEFEIWTDEPSIISGITVERTDNSITVSGIDVDSTIVACYSNSGIVKKKIVESSEITFNQVHPNSTIMLYKHNYIPYIVPMKLQNITMSRSQYVIASDVTAGKSIDSNRTQGDVTIPAGVEYEIEASGVVRLEDGFQVERGATFAVYPSSF